MEFLYFILYLFVGVGLISYLFKKNVYEFKTQHEDKMYMLPWWVALWPMILCVWGIIAWLTWLTKE